MATYKVLQDIEAEDTLVGPLTLRQCIYAAIAVVGIYLSVVFVSKGVPFLIVFSLPFIAFGVFFAFPWTKQQTTEVWALAKVRFYLKPRKRIWNQTGAKQLVTITAPKEVRRTYSSALSPKEVESRLKALADTIDSRGWAVKNVDLGYFTKQNVAGGGTTTDRLISEASLPQDVPTTDAMASEDIFDVSNNPVAQKFDAMMSQQASQHRQQLIQQVDEPQQGSSQGSQQPVAAYWHMRTIQPIADTPSQPVYNQPAPAQATPQQPAYAQPVAYTPQPVYAQPNPYYPQAAQYSQPAGVPTQLPTPQPQNMTAATNPAILELANNNDLDIATIAREAQARNPEPPDEVVVQFH